METAENNAGVQKRITIKEMEALRVSRSRSVSEPSLQVSCSNVQGDRSRKSNLGYEKGRDKIAHWIGSWDYEEVSERLSLF